MNPGMSEEVGQTARSFVTAMSSVPMALALVVSNVALLAFVWFTQYENNKAWVSNNSQRTEVIQRILQSGQDTQQLLAKCAVPADHK